MLISGQAAALVSGNGRQECHLSELLPAASGGVVWGGRSWQSDRSILG